METLFTSFLLNKEKVKYCFVIKKSNILAGSFADLYGIEVIHTPGAKEHVIDKLNSGYTVVIFYENPQVIKNVPSIQEIIERTGCKTRYLIFDTKHRLPLNRYNSMKDTVGYLKHHSFLISRWKHLKKLRKHQWNYTQNIISTIIRLLFGQRVTVYITMSDAYEGFENVLNNRHLIDDLNVIENKAINDDDFIDGLATRSYFDQNLINRLRRYRYNIRSQIKRYSGKKILHFDSRLY